MSNEYTPTTEQVRRDYAYVLFEFGPTPRKLAEFDRWLAQVKAEAQVGALREAADEAEAWEVAIHGSAHYDSDVLFSIRDRADRIAREAGIATEGNKTGESNE